MEELSSQVLNPDRLKALETWLHETGVKLTQVNGQRKYGGPPDDWRGAPPGPGCEVFINQIPRDVFEDQLIPLFLSVGPLWEFRLMMNFSGQNRGFAYAKYDSPALAAAAMRALNGYSLKPGARLSVRRSTEKRQICLGALPASTGREQLLQVLRELSEGVESVTLKTGPLEEGVSALVVYASHHAASMAKKVVVEAFKKRFGLVIAVKWQPTPRSQPDDPVRPPKAPTPLKPPRHPHLSQPPGFSRAVGGPCSVAPAAPGSRQVSQAPPVDAVKLLQGMCEVYGRGKPLYDLQYLHTGPDGFLYFGYRVYVPGLARPLTGMVQTLPGPRPEAIKDEACRAAAKQVLSVLYRA
ncbi:hypothetical protein UPYG_G00217560 [Umbra pygmaea]|uniref:RRM domain-containing protein n=1 Tax=Umbra pygmaea TaxID=75934 RepID=A0ABD0WM01_UMBPY